MANDRRGDNPDKSAGDWDARKQREGVSGRQSSREEKTPAAGPHAKPELTNDMATPGAGALPDPDDEANAQDSTTG